MNKLLFLLLSLAFLVRFFEIQKVPAAMFSDEVDIGVQARSFLETGKDYMGKLSPFYFRSYNSDRTPLPIYLVSLSTKIFQSPELQVRAPFALVGVVIVFLTFQIVKLLTKDQSAAGWAGFISAINPWQIQFSRMAFESIIALGTLMGSIWLFLLWLEKKNKYFIYGSIFSFGISVYSYRTMTLFSPLILVLMVIVFSKDFFKQSRQRLISLGLIFLSLYGSFIFKTVIHPNDQTRISQISIFSDPSVAVWVQRNREVDSGDLLDSTPGKKAIKSSYFFHNKLFSWAESFKNNYLESLSTTFLFLSGDPNLRHSPDGGLMLLPDLLGLTIGLAFIISNLRNNRKYLFLLFLLVLAPLPSCLTNDGGGGHHASRLLYLSAPLIIVAGLGWSKMAKGTILKTGVLLAYFISFIFYYHHYLVHYSIKSSRSFGYGYKEAILQIKEVTQKEEFNSLKLSVSVDPPLPYLWFWNRVEIKKLQAEGLNFAGEIKGIKTIEVINWTGLVDKYKDWTKIINQGELYLVTERDIRPDQLGEAVTLNKVRLLTTINYPDNQPAFYLLTKQDGVYRGSN